MGKGSLAGAGMGVPGKQALTDALPFAPGKRTLTEAITVQHSAAAQSQPGGDSASVREAAQHGMAGPSTTLPHAAPIQASFGPKHDVSRIQAHVGGAAAAASASMGARAYATGDHVAFAAVPSLHLAAHEAAHTIQQRAGVQLSSGVGQAGDAYERHADAVADLVVQGKPATDLLDAMAGGGDSGASVQRDVHLPAHVDNTVRPAWTKAEVIKLQVELKRLGLYRLDADGDLADKTDSALVEAFGDNTWRTMTAATALTRLKAAKPPTGPKGEHALRYGEMFADGLLDITLGVGFDEFGNNEMVLDELAKALGARSFVANNALGAQLYKEAGRALPAKPFGEFYVRPDALTYTPPAGAPRKIHAVVRLVASRDGKQGAEAANAFEDGMVESDVALYGGHGRYGSGPDFDRNFTVDLYDDKKKLEDSYTDYKELEKRLAAEGKPHGRTAWEQFEWRVAKGRIVVRGDNGGNIRMSNHNAHPGEFGAKLMHWNLDQKGTGAAQVTGKGGELEKRTKAHPERKYRVSVFDGCRTDDYEDSLRATGGQDKHATDTFGSTRTLFWVDIADTIAAFLDSIMKMQSAEKVAKAMDDVQATTGQAGKGTVKPFGTDDNPVYK
ncbi:MAG TPA: DUF4157 domain-containing protein [Kofleriaceae bacterium]